MTEPTGDTRPFLALWNDIGQEAGGAYDIWHTHEHVKERASLPGFRSARRYTAAERPHRYFTLYLLDGLDVLTSAAYADVVAYPTGWSQSMRPHFSNVTRLACTTVAAEGCGFATALVTTTIAADVRNSIALAGRASGLLDLNLQGAGITAIRIGKVDRATPDHSALQAQTAPAPAHDMTHVILIEGLWHDATKSAAQTISQELLTRLGGGHIVNFEAFQLAYVFEPREPSETDRRRLPPRDDLRASLKSQD